jgi:hypothetical protein
MANIGMVNDFKRRRSIEFSSRSFFHFYLLCAGMREGILQCFIGERQVKRLGEPFRKLFVNLVLVASRDCKLLTLFQNFHKF